MPEMPLPEFKPRDVSEELNITIPTWMACMYIAESRDVPGNGAIEYISNQIKKELFTQRSVSEQEAILEQHQEMAQFPWKMMRKAMEEDDDDPRFG